MSIVSISDENFLIKDIRELGDIITNYNITNDDTLFLYDLNEYSKKMKNEKEYAYKIVELLGKKVLRKNKHDDKLNTIFRELRLLPHINNAEILYNSVFIELFYKIIWAMLKGFGYATENLYDYIDDFVNILNIITTDEYVIYNCYSTDKYNCGRAMIEIDNYPSKFLIFNTGSEDIMDQNIINKYIGVYDDDHKKQIGINEISGFDKRIINRITKEIKNISSSYDVLLYQLDGEYPLEINISSENINISLKIGVNYPYSKPIGTFNERTISDIDIYDSCKEKLWSEKCNLKNLVDYLVTKYKNNGFPIINRIMIPTRFSAESY